MPEATEGSVMRLALRIVVFAISSLGFIFPTLAVAQAPTASAPQRENPQDLIAKLSPEQKQEFDEARKAFDEGRFADALAIHQKLLAGFPGDPVLTKFAAETAIHGGQSAIAVAMLKPLVATDADDWQAAALLARACAESGDKPCRDAQMSHMLDLHDRGITPPQLRQYVVESVKVGESTVEINTSLVPWSAYKIYALGRVTDSAGKLFLSITLESNDADQPGFAKEHPDQAAKGMRRFSIDTYRETGVDSAGRRTQSQALYEFIDGQPLYETVRDKFIKIASGAGAPVAARRNLQVQ
jgi:hypothetical protein